MKKGSFERASYEVDLSGDDLFLSKESVDLPIHRVGLTSCDVDRTGEGVGLTS